MRRSGLSEVLLVDPEPVGVLGALFRGKFLNGLKKLHESDKLCFVGTSAHLAEPGAFRELLRTLYDQSWVVYAKRPFGGPEQVIRYLGRYTHRVATSSSRIVEVSADAVVFRTHDKRTCRLAPHEFIRRFLLHVLPHRFRKIRHYGLMAPSNVSTRLPLAQDIAAHLNRSQRRDSAPAEVPRPVRPERCPSCKLGRLVRRTLPPARGPPGGAP